MHSASEWWFSFISRDDLRCSYVRILRYLRVSVWLIDRLGHWYHYQACLLAAGIRPLTPGFSFVSSLMADWDLSKKSHSLGASPRRTRRSLHTAGMQPSQVHLQTRSSSCPQKFWTVKDIERLAGKQSHTRRQVLKMRLLCNPCTSNSRLISRSTRVSNGTKCRKAIAILFEDLGYQRYTNAVKWTCLVIDPRSCEYVEWVLATIP